MDEAGFASDFLRASRVAIWGLGLMGGSLAMALKGRCADVVGIDIDERAVASALALGIVKQASTNPGQVLNGADLVILAVPVSAILEALAVLPGLCPGPVFVIDLGSTKRDVMAAMARLPERFEPVGGHPMCGKEKSSLAYAEAGLYDRAPFVLTALERTSSRARAMAETLASAVGARPMWMQPDEHDRVVAATSHAPFLLASALAQATPLDSRLLVGPGFRSTVRLAGSSPAMMIDILETNAENIRAAVGRIKEVLGRYETLLDQGDFKLLAQVLGESAERYRYLSEEGQP